MFEKILTPIKEVMKKPAVIAGLVAVVLVAVAVFSFIQYREVQAELAEFKADPQALIEEENESLIDAVSRLVELPEGEEPTIATITDVERLKDQAFFQKAQNEDKILIYADEGRAILFRPSSNKIIEVAPVNIGDQAQEGLDGGGDIAGASSIAVTIYNGTETENLDATVEEELAAISSDYSVNFRDKATQLYAQTIVIDVSGNNAEDAQALADSLGAQVANLPKNEDTPENADLLVIVGSDRE